MDKKLTTDILNYHKYRGSRGRAPFANQRTISARIDNRIMMELDMECAVSGIKRNALINMAISWYIAELDAARHNEATNVYT